MFSQIILIQSKTKLKKLYIQLKYNKQLKLKMNQDIELVLPLESSEFVIQNAKSVQLNQEAIEQLATKVKNKKCIMNYQYFNNFLNVDL